MTRDEGTLVPEPDRQNTLSRSSSRREKDASAHTRRDLDNFQTAIDRIEARLERIRASERDGFHDGTASYDAATVAVIRIHALREVPEYQPVFAALTEKESLGLGTIRNLAAHAGYELMDDAILWDVATRRLPALLPRLREVANEKLRASDQD